MCVENRHINAHMDRLKFARGYQASSLSDALSVYLVQLSFARQAAANQPVD